MLGWSLEACSMATSNPTRKAWVASCLHALFSLVNSSSFASQLPLKFFDLNQEPSPFCRSLLSLVCSLFGLLGHETLIFLLEILGMLELALHIFYLFAKLEGLLGFQVFCGRPFFYLGIGQATCSKSLAKPPYGLTNQVAFIVGHDLFPLLGRQQNC